MVTLGVVVQPRRQAADPREVGVGRVLLDLAGHPAQEREVPRRVVLAVEVPVLGPHPSQHRA